MKILLGVTGSVAATLTPKLVAEFKRRGHTVEVVATEPSLYFFDPVALWNDLGVRVWRETDEWPRFDEAIHRASRRRPFIPDGNHPSGCSGDPKGYIRDQEIPHIKLGDWADVFVIAPCSAQTLAKLANGMCDNLLTSVARAWHRERPITIAPAMNTRMWEHPATQEHLATLRRWYPRLTIIDPVERRLACGDVGIGAMAPIEVIANAIESKKEN